MYRTIPTGNKICSTKETHQNQQILVTHLQNMKSQIDTKPPQKYGFLNNKKKKEQMQQLKQNEIDRENKHLIQKITALMQNQTTLPPQTQQQYQQQQQQLAMLREEASRKSLNSNHRKQELIKIVMENQALLKRIQDQKSSYDNRLWNKERKDVEKYIANISEFPFKDYKPNKTLVQFWSTAKLNDSQFQKKLFPQKLEPLTHSSQTQIKRDYSQPKQIVHQDQIFYNKYNLDVDFDRNLDQSQKSEPQGAKKDEITIQESQQNEEEIEQNGQEQVEENPIQQSGGDGLYELSPEQNIAANMEDEPAQQQVQEDEVEEKAQE